MTAVLTIPRNVTTNVQFVESDSEHDKQACLSARDFETFVREYADRLLAVAKRFLRSEDDAADAVQDALLAAYQSLDTFHGDATVYTWLYRIVVNVCLMKIRSQPRAETYSLSDLLPTFGEQGYRSQPVSGWTEQAENRLEREETLATVRSSIDSMPEHYRTILLLRDIQELDTDETASQLQLSRSAVKTRLHRARRALRTLLKLTL